MDYLAADINGLVRYEQLPENLELFHLYDGYYLNLQNEPAGTGNPAFAILTAMLIQI